MEVKRVDIIKFGKVLRLWLKDGSIWWFPGYQWGWSRRGSSWQTETERNRRREEMEWKRVNRGDAPAADHVGLLFSALWEPPQTGWEQENGF